LACLPPEHAVDILVVSAFPNDYLATPGSLIGALDREGLSIARLSRSKQADLREEYSCWLSKPVSPRFNFRQVLCIESGWRGTPLQITDDLFRALAPLVLCELVDISVAMPLIGAGDQGCPPDQMLSAILRAAVNWVGRGLKLHVLKIVIHDPQTAQHLLSIFTSHKDEHAACAETPRHDVSADAENFDVFMSYSHKDVELASFMITRLTDAWNGARIFYDQTSLREGSTWPMRIADALDSSRRIVSLYSHDYWTSKHCQMEFLAGFTRQTDTGKTVLFPVYLSEAKIPFMFRTLQYYDCRVNDRSKLASACPRLVMDIR
jgi:TIR domain